MCFRDMKYYILILDGWKRYQMLAEAKSVLNEGSRILLTVRLVMLPNGRWHRIPTKREFLFHSEMVIFGLP